MVGDIISVVLLSAIAGGSVIIWMKGRALQRMGQGDVVVWQLPPGPDEDSFAGLLEASGSLLDARWERLAARQPAVPKQKLLQLWRCLYRADQSDVDARDIRRCLEADVILRCLWAAPLPALDEDVYAASRGPRERLLPRQLAEHLHESQAFWDAWSSSSLAPWDVMFFWPKCISHLTTLALVRQPLVRRFVACVMARMLAELVLMDVHAPHDIKSHSHTIKSLFQSLGTIGDKVHGEVIRQALASPLFFEEHHTTLTSSLFAAAEKAFKQLAHHRSGVGAHSPDEGDEQGRAIADVRRGWSLIEAGIKERFGRHSEHLGHGALSMAEQEDAAGGLSVIDDHGGLSLPEDLGEDPSGGGKKV